MSNPKKQFIKGYELQDLIGEGAYGAVYRAHQPVVDREVAVKILATGCLGESHGLAQFRREMEAIGRLNDPHVVTAAHLEL